VLLKLLTRNTHQLVIAAHEYVETFVCGGGLVFCRHARVLAESPAFPNSNLRKPPPDAHKERRMASAPDSPCKADSAPVTIIFKRGKDWIASNPQGCINSDDVC